MEMIFAWLGAGSGGSVIAVGAAANARLRQALCSPVAAAAVNFLVGFTVLTLLLGAGVFRAEPLSNLPGVPWWAFGGGVLGAAFVTLNTLLVPKLGLTPTNLAIVGSQMVMSLMVDQFGWFGITPQPVTFSRLLAIGLLLVAIALTQLDRPSQATLSAPSHAHQEY